MTKAIWLLPLLLTACATETDQRPPSSSPAMSPARHCEMAREQAEQGDCLSAGEHLAFCSGPTASAVRVQARARCAPSAVLPPESSARIPPVVSVSAEPSAAPVASAANTAGCNQAISHALARRCTAAREALTRCSGPKRATANANVRANCRPTQELENPFDSR